MCSEILRFSDHDFILHGGASQAVAPKATQQAATTADTGAAADLGPMESWDTAAVCASGCARKQRGGANRESSLIALFVERKYNVMADKDCKGATAWPRVVQCSEDGAVCPPPRPTS